MIDEKSALQKQVEKFSRESARSFKEQLLKNIEKIGNISLIKAIANEPVNDPAIIKDIAFQLKSEIDNLLLIIGTVTSGKPYLAIAISDKLVMEQKFKADEIVKIAAKEFGGGGGGQPFFANAGGKNQEKLSKAMEKAVEMVQTAINRG